MKIGLSIIARTILLFTLLTFAAFKEDGNGISTTENTSQFVKKGFKDDGPSCRSQ